MTGFKKKIRAATIGLIAGLWLAVVQSGQGASAGFKELPAFLPRALAQMATQGAVAGTNQLRLAFGLPLHHRDELNALITRLYDARGTNYHQFLTPDDFASRFGPTEPEYQAVIQFAQDHGLTVVRRHRNRLVLDVTGNAADIERAFQVHFHTYRHPNEGRNFFAPDTAPTVPTNLPVADIWGMSDYALPKPQAVLTDAGKISPLGYNGSAQGGSYRGQDFRNAYAYGSPLKGSGQAFALVEFDGYYPGDITNYEAQCNYGPVPLQNVYDDSVSGIPGFSGIGNAVLEVSLDIEMVIAMAPSISKVLVYEGASPYDIYNSIATDNLAKQVSSSWTIGAGPTTDWTGLGGTLDSILSEMAVQGQDFFQAAGDSDAYTGNQTLNGSGGPIPVDSPFVTSVGGTSLSMKGTGASWSSETVWNWGGNTGTGGGISTNYLIPAWQAPVNMATNGGSAINRNIPDVAMAAEAVYVIYNNGSVGVVGGTSAAAPLWAGFCALINQQAVATTPGGMGAGFLNPALYAVGTGTNYAVCFNDITRGNNVGDNTPGLYNAVPGYDLCTGWGSPAGTNLINSLAPLKLPFFLTQPAGAIAAAGSNVTLAAAASGAAPISFQWQFDGTNLSDGGNFSGSASNLLSLTGVVTNESGNYTLILTNAYGSVTSSIAALQVGFGPIIGTQPANQVVLSGGSATFSVATAGSTPFAYLWRKNGANFSRNHLTSGATSNLLTLYSVVTNDDGNYGVVVTNLFGTITSSAASLLVYQPPAIIASSVTNRTVECGSNQLFFSVTFGGTPMPSLQWSLDGVVLPSATNATFALTNLDFPNHIVSVVIANAYASVTNSAVITVSDTMPPMISLNGANPLYVELGNNFTDPGATATDLCAGTVPVVTTGSVNPNAVGTYSLVYSATDSSSNTATATRSVVVRDTAPPAILFSFTNLVLAAGSNCTVSLPNVTGTNDFVATDLSPPLVISQSPTNGSNLAIGSNAVVITVADAYGNTAYSTNLVVVQDQTPPVILQPPVSQTNIIGGTVSFNVAATACTPVSYQWIFNGAPLGGSTNSVLELANLNPALAGNYSVLVTAAGGTSTSAVASLTVPLIAAAGTLVSSENPSGFYDHLAFTEGVTPAVATGTVQFYTNGALYQSRATDGWTSCVHQPLRVAAGDESHRCCLFRRWQ
jgi:subtilase family serine protease